MSQSSDIILFETDDKNIDILFTHPKSALRQAPFYVGLRVSDLRSSPATSSK